MFDPKILDRFRVPPETKVKLKDFDPGGLELAGLENLDKDALHRHAEEGLQTTIRELAKAQERLWASDTYSLLVILQALDAAGKDGIIKHVMSGVNPQGCEVYSFKQPSPEELDHTFLWRCMRRLPQRGRIGIFNRSYYEEVLVVKVHPELLQRQRLPSAKRGKGLWKKRYEDINAFEHHLARNGTQVLKFYLHISKEEQKERFLARLDDPDKNWKFSMADLAERACWEDYRRAYEEALTATSTKWAPWYVIPANHKWLARALVAEILTATIHSLDLAYPEMTDQQREELIAARKKLEGEDT